MLAFSPPAAYLQDMPIPSPQERPDLYDDLDCQDGPSNYPPAGAARGREKLRQRLLANPSLRHLAGRLGTIELAAVTETGSTKEGTDADTAAQ